MKPRLLIIQNRFVIGGHSLDTIPLAYYLKDHFEIKILHGQREPDETAPEFLLEKYKGLDLELIPHFKRNVSLINEVRTFRTLCKHIKHFKPDIIHTHGAKSGLLGRLAGQMMKVPVLIHTFHGHLFHSYFSPIISRQLISIEKWLAKYTTQLIALSETQKNEIQQLLALRGDKISIVPLGVDYIEPSSHQRNRMAFRNKYKIQEETVAIGMIGRIVAIKNGLFMMEVIRHILTLQPNLNIVFFIVGDGVEKPKLMKYLHHHNIPFSCESSAGAKVVFTSWISPIQFALDGIDILALPSLNEGTPLSVIEAQLCAKPVVAVNVGGVRDIMLPGTSGILLKGHSVETFAKAIVQLISNDEERKKMGCAGRNFTLQNFTKEKEVSTFAHLYKHLINS